MMNFCNRIVAFIDILGFKSKVEEAVYSKDVADKLHDALKCILNIKKCNDNTDSFMSMKEYGVEVTTFSDSAVISYPADNIDNLFYLILDIIHLQLELACRDVLLRGGITMGALYHDGDIVYGPAMNQAYYMESCDAVVPRILVDKCAIDKYVKQFSKDVYALQDIKDLLRQDVDGKYFIDMLRQDQELAYDGDEYYMWLCKLRCVIVEGLKNSDIKILMKYQWLRDYYNSVVVDDQAYYPVVKSQDNDEMMEFRKKYMRLRI